MWLTKVNFLVRIITTDIVSFQKLQITELFMFTNDLWLTKVCASVRSTTPIKLNSIQMSTIVVRFYIIKHCALDSESKTWTYFFLNQLHWRQMNLEYLYPAKRWCVTKIQTRNIGKRGLSPSPFPTFLAIDISKFSYKNIF